MTPRKTLMIAGLLIAAGIQAQDKIVTKDAEVIEVYNVEISSNSVFYTLTKDAASSIQKMDKDKIVFIKRQDGTTVNLSVETAAPQPVVQKEEKPEGDVTIVTQDMLSESARQENQKIIDMINADPKITYKRASVANSQSKEIYAVLGTTTNSVFTDGTLEINLVTGYSTSYSKKDPFTFTPFSSYANKYNPSIQLEIRNKTNKTIYIDLGNSFFNCLGTSMCYYKPTSTSVSSSSSSGAGVNLGSVTGALNIGGVVGDIASGVNVGGGSTNGTVSTTYSQRVIAIAPQSVVNLESVRLFSNKPIKGITSMQLTGMFGNEYDMFEYKFILPKKSKIGKIKNGQMISYEKERSPLNYGFVVSYSETEDCRNLRTLNTNLYLKHLVGHSFNNYYGTRHVLIEQNGHNIMFEGILDYTNSDFVLPIE